MDLKNTPFLKIPVIRADIRKQVDEHGTIFLRSAVELQPHPFRVTDRLCFWAKETPNRPFLGQRDGEGKWQTVT